MDFSPVQFLVVLVSFFRLVINVGFYSMEIEIDPFYTLCAGRILWSYQIVWKIIETGEFGALWMNCSDCSQEMFYLWAVFGMVGLYDSVVSIDAGNYQNKIIASRRAVFWNTHTKIPRGFCSAFFPRQKFRFPSKTLSSVPSLIQQNASTNILTKQKATSFQCLFLNEANDLNS